MARSEITLAAPAVNGSAVITKDAIDAVNNHSIDMSEIQNERLDLFIEMDSTVEHTIAIKAGDFEHAADGDLEIVLSAVGTSVVSIETSRFKDYDGLLLIDVTSTGASGNLYATKSPI